MAAADQGISWVEVIVGGAVGAVIAAGLAFGAWFLSAKGEVEEHDQRLRDRREDLATWAVDTDRALEGREAEFRGAAAAKGVAGSGFEFSGVRSMRINALMGYRNEERATLRLHLELKAKEDVRHWCFRHLRLRRKPFKQFREHSAATKALTRWRAPEGGEKPWDPTRDSPTDEL